MIHYSMARHVKNVECHLLASEKIVICFILNRLTYEK